MESVEAVVVGAGVVGLAVARRLALAGHEVLVLEAADGFGTEASSRNSEVIHAGIYYPPGSAKARLCVRGKAMLYRYCEARGVPHRRLGKLLVAVDDAERPLLQRYADGARANGVALEPLTASQVGAMEPAVRAVAGLWSETTGIIDSHALMLAMLGDAEHAGATLACRTRVAGGQVAPDGTKRLWVGGGEAGCREPGGHEPGGDEPMALGCRLLVNSAGLAAQSVARSLDGLPRGSIPPAHFAKGHYFTLSGRSPFHHLVYPMPDNAGLGIHVTLDMAGQCRFGPDVSGWPSAPDYAFDASLEPKFVRAIRRYWPDLADGMLQPGYTGVRSKVTGPTEPAGDFIIQGREVHGIPGLVNLYGIESPGLTASLAIAEQVLERLGLAQPDIEC
jgi:L-2-hydroxyglutarate oxidase LhgO